jgi:hypothetical protein
MSPEGVGAGRRVQVQRNSGCIVWVSGHSDFDVMLHGHKIQESLCLPQHGGGPHATD